MSNTHKAIIIAETHILPDGLKEALAYLNADKWYEDNVKDRPLDNMMMFQPNMSSAELLSEFMGRLCYKSFAPGLNANVTKVREGNDIYLNNVLRQKHGSVFEHATVTFALLNVSRILTHELVRHRAGTAYSQESQRFVRLDDFQMYIPDLTEAFTALAPQYNGGRIPEDEAQWIQDKQDEFVTLVGEVKDFTKAKVVDFIKEIGLDNDGITFHVKKQITSALRRLLPGGVNTNIGVTANHRTWRHVIANRTAPGAEVEIVEVMGDIGMQLAKRYPNIYQDMGLATDHKQLTFNYEKI